MPSFLQQTLALLALTASMTLTLANQTPAFDIATLSIFEPTGRPDDPSPYRIAFDVTDPSDSSSAFCEARWTYAERDTGYPKTYLANCTEPSYAFKFVDWVHYDDFKLDVRHVSKKHGKKVTKFARGKVGYDVIQCAHSGSGFSSCQLKDGVEFELGVYDVRRG